MFQVPDGAGAVPGLAGGGHVRRGGAGHPAGSLPGDEAHDGERRVRQQLTRRAASCIVRSGLFK